MTTPNRITRPAKRDLFGMPVSVTSYADVVARVMDAAGRGAGGLIDFMCVHGLVEQTRDPAFRDMLRSFDIVASDGQPVRWSLNTLHDAKLADRVYGPETMWRTCAAAAREGHPIYLYGSSQPVIDALPKILTDAHPGLIIAGAESPPFRKLSPEEDAAVVERINGSGTKILFIGLGCPKQNYFAFNHRDSIKAVQMCVGAAFDMHAGQTKMAPAWMQKRGLEWAWRLMTEPRRLWKRYVFYNTRFVGMFGAAVVRKKLGRGKSAGVGTHELQEPEPLNLAA